jgi:hypothetical protein
MAKETATRLNPLFIDWLGWTLKTENIDKHHIWNWKDIERLQTITDRSLKLAQSQN